MQEAHTRSMCFQGRTARFPVVPAQDRAPHVQGLSVSLAAADRKGNPQLAGLWGPELEESTLFTVNFGP